MHSAKLFFYIEQIYSFTFLYIYFYIKNHGTLTYRVGKKIPPYMICTLLLDTQ